LKLFDGLLFTTASLSKLILDHTIQSFTRFNNHISKFLTN